MEAAVLDTPPQITQPSAAEPEPKPALARNSRQKELVPPAVLATYHALVLGVGSVGRRVALDLAAMGIPELTLYDDDFVAIENLAPQAYLHRDLGVAKVHATATMCYEYNPETKVAAVPDRFKRSTNFVVPEGKKLVIFCAVDKLAIRKLLWETIGSRADLWADGRMSGEAYEVYHVLDTKAEIPMAFRESRNLMSREPAQMETVEYVPSMEGVPWEEPCTARSTGYTAAIVAGLMLEGWVLSMRGLLV